MSEELNIPGENRTRDHKIKKFFAGPTQLNPSYRDADMCWYIEKMSNACIEHVINPVNTTQHQTI